MLENLENLENARKCQKMLENQKILSSPAQPSWLGYFDPGESVISRMMLVHFSAQTWIVCDDDIETDFQINCQLILLKLQLKEQVYLRSYGHGAKTLVVAYFTKAYFFKLIF